MLPAKALVGVPARCKYGTRSLKALDLKDYKRRGPERGAGFGTGSCSASSRFGPRKGGLVGAGPAPGLAVAKAGASMATCDASASSSTALIGAGFGGGEPQAHRAVIFRSNWLVRLRRRHRLGAADDQRLAHGRMR
jgi:hypothetical protein